MGKIALVSAIIGVSLIVLDIRTNTKYDIVPMLVLVCALVTAGALLLLI